MLNTTVLSGDVDGNRRWWKGKNRRVDKRRTDNTCDRYQFTCVVHMFLHMFAEVRYVVQYQKRQREFAKQAKALMASGVERSALEPEQQKALVPHE